MLILQELISNHHEQITVTDIDSILGLYVLLDNFRKRHTEGQGLAKGKYKLVLVLLIRHCFESFHQACQMRFQDTSLIELMYTDLFVREEDYSAKFEGEMYAALAMEIIGFMWKGKHGGVLA